MRIFVNSDEGGKPFELFNSEDNQLDRPGWYYQLMQWVPGSEVDKLVGTQGNPGRYEPLDLDGPTGPFETINDAFGDAIMCNY